MIKIQVADIQTVCVCKIGPICMTRHGNLCSSRVWGIVLLKAQFKFWETNQHDMCNRRVFEV